MTAKFKSELMRGSLDLLVLSVLTGGAKYGYSLQQDLCRATGGLVDLKAGTLYPLLHRLEADKLIRARWDASSGRKRKWYDLTAKGRRRVRQQAQQWLEYADCLRRIVSPVMETKA